MLSGSKMSTGIRLRAGIASNGTRPNRFNSKQFSEPILSQGEINMDCSVDPRLGAQRQDATKGDIPTDQVMGLDLGDNLEFVDIHMGEPLLRYKRMIASNGQERLFPRKAFVFSSVNGMYIVGKSKHMTQDDWEDQFDFAGISNGDVTFGMGKMSTMKVSTRIAGSGTLENTGNDEFHIGDDIVWCLNSIDPRERAMELEELPDVQYKSKRKMGIIWKRLDYADATYYLQDALTKTFDEKWDEYTNDFTVLLDNDKNVHIPNDIRIGLQMRLLVAFASYNGIVQAIERGWVKPRTPSDFKVNSFDAGYDSPSWQAIESISPLDLSRGKVDKEPGVRHGLRYRPAEDLTEEEKREQTRVKEFLAAKHGFFGDVFGRGTIVGSRPFLDTITCRTLRGMIRSDDPFQAGDISQLFHADPEEGPGTVLGAARINHIHSLSTLIGHLSAIQGRVGNDLYGCSVQARNKVYSKRVAKSLTHSLGGEKWNYILTIH